MDVDTTDNQCPGCKEDYNEDSTVKLSCPGCEKFERCTTCFKAIKYICGECYYDWSEKDKDGSIVGYDEVNLKPAASNYEIYSLYITDKNGRSDEYKVNKSKTFKVIKAKVKYELLKAFIRCSENKDRYDRDYLNVFYKIEIKYNQSSELSFSN